MQINVQHQQQQQHEQQQQQEQQRVSDKVGQNALSITRGFWSIDGQKWVASGSYL